MKTNTDSAVSIVVPTLNEEDNIEPLIKRIDTSMKRARLDYSVIVIDDHSVDKTEEKVKRMRRMNFPVMFQKKRGKRGKAFSLIQGFNTADNDVVCMIDADLQYPPEAIPQMVRTIENHDVDVVLTHRIERQTSPLRRLVSKTYNIVFARWLFGIDYDTQSGLKVFRRNVMKDMKLKPSPWSFDLEFITKCLQRKKRIVSQAIQFADREHGEAKVSVIKSSFELAKASLDLRRRVSRRAIREGFEYTQPLQRMNF